MSIVKWLRKHNPFLCERDWIEYVEGLRAELAAQSKVAETWREFGNQDSDQNVRLYVEVRELKALLAEAAENNRLLLGFIEVQAKELAHREKKPSKPRGRKRSCPKR